MIRTTAALSVLLPLLAAAHASSQDPNDSRNAAVAVTADAPVPALRVPIHTAAPDEGVAYGTWAAGDTYKASFDGGMTFVPYLGGEYPHNQPLGWRTLSVAVGGVELLADAPQTDAGVRVSDFRYEYRHGAVTEAYDVLVGGLEQTFVVDRLPAAGDLVVTGAVTTAMRCDDAAPAHRALRFRDEQGRELVSYGEAFAFDARGDRVAVRTGYDDGRVTLRVPAQWLQTAALPVTIDPLLTRVQISGWGTLSYGTIADIDISSAVYQAIVYTRQASATDHDCYGIRTADDFSAPQAVWADLTASWSSSSACCAWSQIAHGWLFAWSRRFTTSSPVSSRIRWHAHDWLSTTFSTTYGGLAATTGRNDWRPDIGACPFLNTFGGVTSDHFMIVFQYEDNGAADFADTDDSSIGMAWLQLPAGAANATLLGVQGVRSTTHHDHERPCVRQRGISNQWELAWQRYDTLAPLGNWDIEVSVYEATTTQPLPIERVAQLLPNQTAGTHQTGPVIASGSIGAIAYSESAAGTTGKIATTAGSSLVLQTFDYDVYQAPGMAIHWRGLDVVRQSTSRIWEATGLAWNTTTSSHFGLGFRAVAPGVPTAYCARYAAAAALMEGGTGAGSLLYYVSGHTPSAVAVAHAGNDNSFRFAYGVGGAAGMPVFAHQMEAPSAPPILTSGYGCATNWTLSWEGTQLIGSLLGRLRVDAQTPQFSLLAMVLSIDVLDIGILDPVVAPGCRLLVDTFGPGYIGMLPPAFGSDYQRFTLPLPGYLPAMDIHVQGVVFDGVLFETTHRLTLPIVR